MPENKVDAEAQDPKTFSLKVHHRDRRGVLLNKQPYTMFVKGGVQYFERPVNSGNIFFENMDPAGRVERHVDKKGVITAKFDFEAEHKEYIPPVTGAEKIAMELEQSKAKNEALERELLAIKKERDLGAKLETAAQENKIQADRIEAAVEIAAAIEAPLPDDVAKKPSIPTLKKG